MSERIAVGDLVQVVKWPCCNRHTGKIFTVVNISGSGGVACAGCRAIHYGAHSESDLQDGDVCWAPNAWLKRIPPLDEIESIKRDEEITA